MSPSHLWVFTFFCSKLKDAEVKNRELEEQLESMKKDLEESRTRSDRGDRVAQFLLLFSNQQLLLASSSTE